MSGNDLGLPDRLYAYLVEHGVREHAVLRDLRSRTATLPQASMQISPDEGAFLALLVKLMGARRCLEIGTFTGYSSTSVALALPDDGQIVCCDVSREWTDIARQAWTDAGVAEKVELRLGPARDTLDALLDEGAAGTFDFAFIDADKPGYDDYFERCLRLVRAGGLIVVDNVLWSGLVADPADQEQNTVLIRAFNDKLATDDRIDLVITPIADGVTLARVRG